MNDLEKTARTFDEYGNSYSQTVNDAVAFTGLSVDFFTQVKAAYLVDLVSENLGDPLRLTILDIGCGVGNFHPLLAPKFGGLTGVDISPASIEVAKTNYSSVHYDVYDGRRLPYEDASFDVAFTICVMYHVLRLSGRFSSWKLSACSNLVEWRSSSSTTHAIR